MTAMSNTISATLRNIGAHQDFEPVTSEKLKDNQKVSRIVGVIKIAALVTLVSAITTVIFAILTMEFLGMAIIGSAAALAIILSRDIYVIASRIQKTVDYGVTEANLPRYCALTHKYNQARYLTEGTWIVQSIVLLAIDRTLGAKHLRREYSCASLVQKQIVPRSVHLS